MFSACGSLIVSMHNCLGQHCFDCRGNMEMSYFRFSWRRVWRWLSSELLRCVVWQKITDVLEVLAASIIRAMSNHGGSKNLWNVGKHLPDYTAQQPRRQPSSFLETSWMSRKGFPDLFGDAAPPFAWARKLAENVSQDSSSSSRYVPHTKVARCNFTNLLSAVYSEYKDIWTVSCSCLSWTILARYSICEKNHDKLLSSQLDAGF
jgi:hypothetical protein